MHACAHDVNMTVFIGAARRLTSMTDQWQGTLVMIAQPAEERGAGARAMLKDGLFERFPRPDYNFGLHVAASMPAGVVIYTKGHVMAAVDTVDITVYGIGGHGAYPHRTKDPVVLSAQIINALQTLGLTGIEAHRRRRRHGRLDTRRHETQRHPRQGGTAVDGALIHG